MSKKTNLKTCSHCEKQVFNLAAKGLCAACYMRQWKRGTLERVERKRSPCTVEGCDELSVAQGYCETHYRRWKKHGVAEHERFDRWGHVSKHPLAHTYYWLRQKEGVRFPEEWKDFWQFERDVGERPTPRHKLSPINKKVPIGPGNVHWRGPKFDINPKDDPAAYARLTVASRPRERKAAFLKKVYGITIDQYDDMAKAQGNKCAICRSPEATPSKSTGLPRDLAVDHCHGRGHVRALLCSRCNAGLGNFNDDPELMLKAIEYLNKHALLPESS